VTDSDEPERKKDRGELAPHLLWASFTDAGFHWVKLFKRVVDNLKK